jgi:hypothetical protein
MPEVCSLRIGDISVALIPDMLDGSYDTPPKFSGFQVEGPADISLKIHFNQSPDVPAGDLVFDSGHGWRQSSVQDSYVLRVSSAYRDPRLVGVFSKDFRSGAIYTGVSETNPDQFIFPFTFPLGEIYMTNLLGTGLGVMLHSCGVIRQGSGLVFAGVGGAGKSTTSRLWQKQSTARVVNDDRVIIRRIGRQFRLYGTPWHGEGGMALPEDAPLKRIFIIKHASSNQLIPLTPAQAVHGLLARSFSPFWSTAGLKFTLQFLAELCQEIPCFEFGFLPDQSAVDFICNLEDGSGP